MSFFQITIDTLMDKEEQSRIGINPDNVEHERESTQILCRILEEYSNIQAENTRLREALEEIVRSYRKDHRNYNTELLCGHIEQALKG